jgi:1-hydroxycarotenoid 3,4-desaturase
VAEGGSSAGRLAVDDRVVVIGAGVGGLVAALLLASRGLQVDLVEAASAPGGKMRQIGVDGASIDGGPTVFTMRWVFDEILDQAGCSADSLPQLDPLGVLARHAWRNCDARLDLLADVDATVDAIGRFSGSAEARRYRAFCEESRRVYQRLLEPAIRSPRPTLARMLRDLGPSGLGTLARLGPFASLWSRLGRYFHDARLRQLFGRYSTYCGGSPWLAPATLMLVAHVEQCGVWSVSGGMHALARSLASLATGKGARLRFGTRCTRIMTRDGRVAGVELDSGEVLAAGSVVFNGDSQALAAGLLGKDARAAVDLLPRGQRSLSALTWAFHARTTGFPLVRHNVFFDDDYASEFDDIFAKRSLPQRGTVYVCAQDRDDRAVAPDGRERLLFLVNAPPDGDRPAFDDAQVESCLTRSLEMMAGCGLELEPSSPRLVTKPTDFEQLFPATGGALYGRATHGWMTIFRRPGSISRLPGLYLAGGSVHPGPGVPMAALSGRLAAEALLASLDSTSPSRQVAISGGTSTRSATTADSA